MATATEQGAKTEAGKAAAKERVQNQGQSHSAATRATPGKDAKSETKRKILTPAERVAKLEADLKEAREKAEKTEKAKLDKVRERRESIVKRVNPLVSELNELNRQLDYPIVDLVPVGNDETKG